MKTTAKRTGAIIAFAAYATTVVAGLGFTFGGKAFADAKDEGSNYFYGNLFNNTRAQRFYSAFEKLEKDGAFKKGEIEYDIVANGTIAEQDVIDYVEVGRSALPVAYSSARDTYIMDHPDLFYVDLFGTSINAGTMGGNYVAFLDSSRTATLYTGYLNTEEKINSAITEYESVLSTIVSGAKAAGDTKAQIEYVNKYICEHTEYSFCSSVVNNETVYEPEADYISTSYGALVNGKAICGGYANAFKAVMDRLEIPCTLVQGYKKGLKDETFDPHMWNAVKLEGHWYGVDVTWNDTANSDKWILLGESDMSIEHVEDNIISSSGFELKYPALKPYNYGVDNDDNGMKITGDYIQTSDHGSEVEISIEFDGKGAKKLKEAGKYLVVRFGDKDESNNVVWGFWYEFESCADFMFPTTFTYNDNKSMARFHAGFEYVQFALVDYAPDYDSGATYPEVGHSSYPSYYTPEMQAQVAGKPFYYIYDPDNLTAGHFIVNPSAPYKNEAYGTYIPAPAATSVTPANSATLSVNGTYDIQITYDEELELSEGKTLEDIGLLVTSQRNNSTLAKNIKVENFKWDGNKTISFTFTPSRMYEHNDTSIYFVPDNLEGKNSHKAPEPVIYAFKGKSVVCSKVFNDGRLYMLVYGEPQLLDTTDLSTEGFKDNEGNYVAKNQTSQLLLVAQKPSHKEEEDLENTLVDQTALKKEDIVESSTYEINLHMCGLIQTVPNGSFMQVKFGFPEGYSKDDAGTTFKIYHYKHDEQGNITGVEEIPVIITEYGLIARVNSFSPFVVVQVKKSSEAVKEGNKTIYASVSGIGGTVRADDGIDGIREVTGDSVTYNLTADAGFAVKSVMLNGKALASDRYADGKVTLTKEELKDGNTLEVSYMTKKSADSYVSRGIEIKQPDMTVVDFSSFEMPSDPLAKASVGEIVGIVIASVALAAVAVAGVGLIVYFVKKPYKG